jgi:hypothetical protein
VVAKINGGGVYHIRIKRNRVPWRANCKQRSAETPAVRAPGEKLVECSNGLHALEHPESRHSMGATQPPAFYFVHLFAHAGKRVTFPHPPKYKNALLQNMVRGTFAASTSTKKREEP